MSISTSSDLSLRVSLLQRAAAYSLQTLSAVTEDELGHPTPCPGWDLRALTLHMAESARGLGALVTSDPLTVDVAPAGPVAAAQQQILALAELLESAVHDADAARAGAIVSAASAGAIEFTTHGWDVARATGDASVPGELATEVLALASALVDDATRQQHFGPVQEVAPDASAGDRLAAFLGRSVG